MKTQHTPGPWRYDSDGVIGSEGKHIASVTPVNRQGNSPLIAAAPELLEALQMWQEFIDMQLADESDLVTVLTLKFHGKRIEATRAAIKKALGE